MFIFGGLVSQQARSISSLDNTPGSKPELIATEVGISQLVKANNDFGFNLFSQLQQQKSQPQNIFISPQSIAIALTMTRNGTKGKTLQEINQTLELKFDLAQLDLSYSKLIQILTTADPTIKLAIANSLWVNQNIQNIQLKDRFIEQTQEFYRGKVTNLNFANSSAPETINQWVARAISF